ncbi:MAG: RNA polymerase sigma factor [Duncaniella sp.]|nr:RNA polymerase sigma factor [Duncaniella sp.]MDE6467242.1 RNA polymerase sigma factor [Duncaniella sp.]
MKQIENIFRERFLPLYPGLYKLARVLLGDNPEEAADVVQDTMVKIWNMGEAMLDIESPSGFAVSVTRTTAIDFMRRKKTYGGDSMDEIQSETLPDPDTAAFLEKMIDTLPAAQQTVVRLSLCGELSNDEIAEATGQSPDNVRQLLSRGRRKLRVLYTKYMKP